MDWLHKGQELGTGLIRDFLKKTIHLTSTATKHLSFPLLPRPNPSILPGREQHNQPTFHVQYISYKIVDRYVRNSNSQKMIETKMS